MDSLLFLFLLVPLFAILYLSWGIFKDVSNTFSLLGKGLSKNRIEILKQYQPYYIRLNKENKAEFEQRVNWWLAHKTFIPRQMPKVTEEMKVLVAACAVQLTFGLKIYYFRHFKKIVLYPDSYYSEINKKYHRGEVNPQFGLIILSWKAFVQGYIEHDSGRNLGLHEIAHAIKLETYISVTYNHLMDQRAWKNWHDEVSNFINEKQANGFFRSYAFTDEHEFFAVAIENFFERPIEFLQLKPNLYNCLVNLLHQDPIKLLNLRQNDAMA